MSRFNHTPLGKRRRSPQSCRDALRFDSRCANTFAGNRAPIVALALRSPLLEPSKRSPALGRQADAIASLAGAIASSVHAFACRVPSLGSPDGAIGLREYPLDLSARGHPPVAGSPGMSPVVDSLGTPCYWLLAIGKATTLRQSPEGRSHSEQPIANGQ